VSRRDVIVVFAKAPREGAVKTRMTPPLTPREAAELYAALLDDTLGETARAARELDLDPVLAVHPPGACAELAGRAPAGFRAVPQRGAGLAERMDHALREAAAGGAGRVLLRGSDSPLLDTPVIGRALAALESCDLVLCPDRDGGYHLAGARRPAPGLFDHPMSTGSVLRDTLARADALGLSARVQDPGFDLDTAEDLRWLAHVRARGEARVCEKTLTYLDTNGVWGYLTQSQLGGEPRRGTEESGRDRLRGIRK
jgi:rSAM/selenodomain-associated transferase 1